MTRWRRFEWMVVAGVLMVLTQAAPRPAAAQTAPPVTGTIALEAVSDGSNVVVHYSIQGPEQAAGEIDVNDAEHLVAQTVAPREQPLVIKSLAGADLFKFYCSTCHGADAKGRPAAVTGQPAAPDLTLLARRNGGVFPRARVIDVVRNGTGSPASHGPAGMPVWGAIFRGLDPDDSSTAIRIENLVDYLQSRQEHVVDLGR